MEINPIKTEADNEAALKEIEALWNSPEGTPEGDRLEILVTLVHAFEEKAYPMESPDAVAMLEFMMEQRDATEADLAALFEDADAAREILARKRYLTLPQIWKLEKEWHIPAETLVAHYDLVA
jgi:HTH-type transcriptional regulator/antitoxin HigA